MIEIINTGVANIRSLQAAFDRLGLSWRLTIDSNQIADGEGVVLPGVGSFAAAVERLDQLQLRQSLLERIAADRPLLCICLGLQMLAEASDESPGVQGLGIIQQQIKRFSNKVQVPQLGWNEVRPIRSDRRTEGGVPSSKPEFPVLKGDAYFANSFRLLDAPEGWGYAETDYDGAFISSLWRGRLLACQFHPELSGTWGEELIKRWVES